MTATEIPDAVGATDRPSAKPFSEVNRDAIRFQLRIDAANAAMTGLLASGMFTHNERGERCEKYAKLAVQQADALLAELAK